MRVPFSRLNQIKKNVIGNTKQVLDAIWKDVNGVLSLYESQETRCALQSLIGY